MHSFYFFFMFGCHIRRVYFLSVSFYKRFFLFFSFFFFFWTNYPKKNSYIDMAGRNGDARGVLLIEAKFAGIAYSYLSIAERPPIEAGPSQPCNQSQAAKTETKAEIVIQAILVC